MAQYGLVKWHDRDKAEMEWTLDDDASYNCVFDDSMNVISYYKDECLIELPQWVRGKLEIDGWEIGSRSET